MGAVLSGAPILRTPVGQDLLDPSWTKLQKLTGMAPPLGLGGTSPGQTGGCEET